MIMVNFILGGGGGGGNGRTDYRYRYRWALKDAIDLVAYSEAPDLLQDIQY